HRERMGAWHPQAYPSVDIYLPICGEPIEMLRGTWDAVFELIAAYPGPAKAYVLDDGPSDKARSVAESLGFSYFRRPDLRAYKKSGNLRYAFARTSGEYLVIFDADFAPRPDFLAETLPYMDDPATAIVQTPQFFRSDGPSDKARSVAESLGFSYFRRPDLRAYKKSGNLRYAFARTSGEYLVIFDADFAPRPDFLAETLPYMDDPATAIVQTPQFF